MNVIGYVGPEIRDGFNAFCAFFDDQITSVDRRFDPFLGFDGLLSGSNAESFVEIVDLRGNGVAAVNDRMGIKRVQEYLFVGFP